MIQDLKNKNLSFLRFQDSSKETQKPLISEKRAYARVGIKERKQLMKLIVEDGLTIKSAAQRLKINYSTAKNIVKIFRREQCTGKDIESLHKKEPITLKRFIAKKTFTSSESNQSANFYKDSATILPNDIQTTVSKDKIEFDFTVYSPLIYERYLKKVERA